MRTFKITECTDKKLIGKTCICKDEKVFIENGAYNIAKMDELADGSYCINAVNLILYVVSE